MGVGSFRVGFNTLGQERGWVSVVIVDMILPVCLHFISNPLYLFIF